MKIIQIAFILMTVSTSVSAEDSLAGDHPQHDHEKSTTTAKSTSEHDHKTANLVTGNAEQHSHSSEETQSLTTSLEPDNNRTEKNTEPSDHHHH